MAGGWTDNKAQGIGRARGGAVVRDIASGEGGWILLFHTELITAENKTSFIKCVKLQIHQCEKNQFTTKLQS